uniref:BZIP domain-containing protein n=1 Tax=Magallana gigas TaxID=29159 RepID=A0A8W8LBR0_MAGGI|nr:thyrotroph embryonic factor isoform X2 [Crassostrea gigas]
MAYNTFGDSRYTLKNLLEIPELQHPPILNGHLDSKKTGVSSGYGIPSAFLGPTNLWNNANQIGGQGNGEFSLQYMDLDEFLSENGIPSSELNTVNNQCAQSPQEPKLDVPPSENYIQLQTPPTPQALSPGLPPKRTSPNSPRQVYEDVHETSAPTFYSSEGLRSPSSPYKCTESSNGSSVSSQSTNQSSSNDPSAQPIIAGQENFDPRKCKFSDEELKPQPIIRKSRKVFVPDACKDERYWMRRSKNNIAAKRSREARRIKENQIALRAAFLEKENNALKDEVNKIKEENVNLQKKLSQYEQVGK